MTIGLILPRVMLVYFGSEINGLVTSITQFVAYFGLVEAGISGSVTYYLYKPLAEKDKSKVSSILKAAKIFYVKAGCFFLTLVLLLALFYPMFIETELLSFTEIFVLVLIVGMSGTLDFFIMAKYRVLLTADQKTYVISIASIASNLLNVLIITILASHKFDIVVVRFYAIFSIFLRTVILYFYTRRIYPYLNFKIKSDNTALNKRWAAFYLQLLGVFQAGIPVILATIFTSLKMVSVYSIYMMVIAGVRGLFSIFDNGLASGFGEVISKNEKTTLQKAYSEFEFAYYFIMTFIYSVTILLIGPFIKLYTKGINDIDYNSVTLCFLFVFSAFCYNLKNPQGMMVISAGLYKETRLQASIQAGLLFVVGIILTPLFGLSGILIALIISDIYRVIDLMLFIPKNVTKLSYKSTLKRIVSFSLIFIIISYFSINKIDLSMVSSYSQWLLFALSSATIIFVIILAVAFIIDKKEINNLQKRMLFSFKRLYSVS
jgi:O-antigen/teichoic acid export membrane protein